MNQENPEVRIVDTMMRSKGFNLTRVFVQEESSGQSIQDRFDVVVNIQFRRTPMKTELERDRIEVIRTPPGFSLGFDFTRQSHLPTPERSSLLSARDGIDDRALHPHAE